MHTFGVENNLLLPLLSIEGSLVSEDGGGDQQMITELLNEEFSVERTRQKPWKYHKKSYDTLFATYKWGVQQISW